MHLNFTLHLNHRTSAGISLAGRNILDYDSNFNTINGQYYSPQDPTSMDLTADVYIDRTSVEVFIDGGRHVMTGNVYPDLDADTGVQFFAEGGSAVFRNIVKYDILV